MEPGTAELSDQDIEQELPSAGFAWRKWASTYHADYARQRHDPDVAPPLLSSDRPGPASESVRLSCESIRLVDQQVETFSSLQNRVDVLHHDVFAARQRCSGYVSCYPNAKR